MEKGNYESEWERKGKKQRNEEIITKKESESTRARVRSNTEPNIYVSDVHTYMTEREKKKERESESERESNPKDRIEIEVKIKGENEYKSEHGRDGEFDGEANSVRQRARESGGEGGGTRRRHSLTHVDRVQEQDQERGKVGEGERAGKRKREGDRERSRQRQYGAQIRSEGSWSDLLAVVGGGNLAIWSSKPSTHHNLLTAYNGCRTNWGTPSRIFFKITVTSADSQPCRGDWTDRRRRPDLPRRVRVPVERLWQLIGMPRGPTRCAKCSTQCRAVVK